MAPGGGMIMSAVFCVALYPCPVKYEVYVAGVGGYESAQSKNNKIKFPGCPTLPARLNAKLM